MTFKTRLLLALFLLAIVSIATAAAFALYYRGNAIDYKSQRDKATGQLKLANETIDDMQVRQRDVSALDAKYTKELADAQGKLNVLERCVSSGKCGLRLNATCSKANSTSTSSMDDAATPRLTDTAERDYFTLRSRIETVTRQLTGLQSYVREQCLQ